MRKALFFAPLLLLLMTQTHSAPVDAKATSADFQQNENKISISTRSEIVGLWGMDIPGNQSCVEYYNFRGNNEIVVNSAKEWTVGLFEYQPVQEDNPVQLPTLTMQLNYENNETDCSGNRVDQSGELSQYFVKWQNPNQIDFCSGDKEGQCFASLRRILP